MTAHVLARNCITFCTVQSCVYKCKFLQESLQVWSFKIIHFRSKVFFCL